MGQTFALWSQFAHFLREIQARNDLDSRRCFKKYKINLTRAKLFVRKMTVSDQVFTAIEKTLTKIPALYRYTEVLPKTISFPLVAEVGAKRMYLAENPLGALHWLYTLINRFSVHNFFCTIRNINRTRTS